MKTFPRAGIAISFAFVIALGFIFLRLVNLNADMPSNITWSETLYTDEGIYARNAVWFAASGNWYVKGDLNTSINYPVYSLLQALVFKIFSVGYHSLRAISAVSAIASSGLTGFIVKRFSGNRAAAIALLILSTNFLFFAFSRYGQADMLMILLVLSSIACLLLQRVKISSTALSGIFAILAMLTKTSAVFVIPVLLVLIWSTEGSPQRRRIHTAILIGITGLGLGLYHIFLVQPFYEDYQLVLAPLRGRMSLYPQDLIAQFLMQMRRGQAAVGLPLYILTILAVIPFFKRPQMLKGNLCLLASFAWLVFGCLMLSTSSYHPPRYFSILVIPFSMIIGIATDSLLSVRGFKILNYLITGIIIATVATGCIRILGYMAYPNYSIYDVANTVKADIWKTKAASPLLIGHASGNVSLANGILSVGAHFDDQTELMSDFPIERYSPTHFISLMEANSRVRQDFMEAGFVLKFLSKCEVIDSYKDKSFYVYRVEEETDRVEGKAIRHDKLLSVNNDN